MPSLVHKPDVDLFQEPYFFFSNNHQLEILYISPSVERVLGYSPKEMVGCKYTEFIQSGRELKRFQNQSQNGSLSLASARNGNVKILRMQAYEKTDESGAVVSKHIIAQDVSSDLENNERLGKLLRIESAISERESDVLNSVVNGTPNKAIARQLNISERAIEMVRAKLMKKFSVNSAAELVGLATELSTLRRVFAG